MPQLFTVTLSGHARHNHVRYNPGASISGLTDVQVKRLQRAKVVADVKAEVPEPSEPPGITAEQVLGANAKDAIELIGQVDEVPLLQAIIEQDERATVKQAAEKRLAELTNDEDE